MYAVGKILDLASLGAIAERVTTNVDGVDDYGLECSEVCHTRLRSTSPYDNAAGASYSYYAGSGATCDCLYESTTNIAHEHLTLSGSFRTCFY